MVEQKPEQKRVVAQSVKAASINTKKLSNRELMAMVCYHYPQYKLTDVAQLPIRDIKLLLHTAEKIQAEKMYNLTQIAAAPHTKKGEGVKQLTDYFRKAMDK